MPRKRDIFEADCVTIATSGCDTRFVWFGAVNGLLFWAG